MPLRKRSEESNINTDTQISKPIIEINNLGFHIGGDWIHRHLDLTVFRGEILGIVGGSGCGKTTLLKQILQLETPAEGSIKVLGREIFSADEKEINEIRQHWGVVFQQGALFSSLTALENIAFPLKHYTHLNQPIIDELALLKLKLVGLPENAAWKYPDELSGGMKKRVAIARACVMDPTLLFLDEPTAGLDPQSAFAFEELILSLKNSLDLTVILVTHDVDTLWHITDRVAFLAEKHVLELAPIAELSQSKQPIIKEYFRDRASWKTR